MDHPEASDESPNPLRTTPSRPDHRPVTVVTGTVARTSLVVAGLLVGLAVSLTRPFTWPSELAVSLGFVAVLAVVAAQWWVPSVPPSLARRELPPLDPDGARWGSRWAPWWLVLSAVVGWELFSYASAPRSAHPTLSVMVDAIDANHVGHGACFVAWLVLGWYLVTR